MANLPEKLVYYRKASGLTQSEAAKRIHISRSTLAGYETGARQPGFAILQDIANAYGIQVNALYDEVTSYQAALSGGDPNHLTPGTQILLQTLKGASEDEILQAVKIIEALRK